MSIRKQEQNLTVRYSFIQWFFWMSFCSLLGFSSVYLLDNGFTNTQIGIILAIACVISAVLQPAIASLIDKPQGLSLKKVLIVLSIIQICLGALMIVCQGTLIVGLFFGGSVLFGHTINPLLSSLCVESMNQGKKINFGIARGLGSLAYAVASFMLGRLTAQAGAISIPICLVILYAAMLVALLLFPFEKNAVQKAQQTGTKGRNPIQFLLHYKRYTILLIGFTLTYISHMVINSFGYQIAVSKGGGSSEMGIMFGLMAVMELPTMFLFVFMLKVARSHVWVRVSSVFFLAKTLGTLLVPNMAGCYAVQIFQMFGFALLTVAVVYYVNSIMEPQDSVKGQAYATMTYTLGSVISTFFGGMLIDRVGMNDTLVIATVISIAGMFIMLFATQKTKE